MSAWVRRFTPGSSPAARLICFPHAGGAAMAFRLWPEALPEALEVVAVQLPGRANRLSEPPIASVPRLIDHLRTELEPYLDRPYAFFGHSMGAVLALELARELKAAGLPEPSHLFLSARRPPHLPTPEPHLHPLPDAAFIDELGRRYGGIPAEILEHQDLIDLLLPAMRADITALETFTSTRTEPLSCPLTAFCGEEDRFATLPQIREWRSYTKGPFRVRAFRGGHFYLEGAQAELLSDIRLTLSPMLTQGAAQGAA